MSSRFVDQYQKTMTKLYTDRINHVLDQDPALWKMGPITPWTRRQKLQMKWHRYIASPVGTLLHRLGDACGVGWDND